MQTIDFHQYPDNMGHFGVHGGRFASETLMVALEELEKLYTKVKSDPVFWQTFQDDLVNYVGRPTPLYFAKRLTDELAGAKIFLKREDLNHTGAHKVNNTIGQALLAKNVWKKADYRRDWGGTTWGRNCYNFGSAWARMCGVYGG